MSDGWTVATLRDHFLALLDGQDKRHADRLAQLRDFIGHMAQERGARYDQRFVAQDVAVAAALQAAKEAVAAALAAADRAVAKAEVASDARFASVNEFRAALTDQTATFMPRTEAEQRIGANAEKIGALERALPGLVVRSEYETGHKALEDRIAAITSRIDRNDGRSTGLQSGWGYIVGAVGLAAAVVGLVMALR